MSRAHRAVAPAPTYDAVVAAVRAALNHPDPIERAEAAARLMKWGLPVGPRAITLVAQRAMSAQPA